MNKITIREINKGNVNIIVTADEQGIVYVNGKYASRPVKVDGVTFVWSGPQHGLPPHSKIGLTAEHLHMIEQHSAEARAASEAAYRAAVRHNNSHNEGGEGFVPTFGRSTT